MAHSDVIPVDTVLDSRYIVVERLSDGGFATIYRARHLLMDKDVAIKVLRDVDNDMSVELRQRFVGEAKIIAQLNHPNIVGVHDMGLWGPENRPYFVMDLLNGFDASQHLKSYGPFEPGRILPSFIDVLDAIGQVHERGFVHKDLKPSNLFLVEPETVRERLMILDFGVARQAMQASSMTMAGQFVGTCQ